MKVLLSIKPEYVDKIFSGEKWFEFRKTIFKREVSRVIIYATSPVQRIVGEFEAEAILECPIDDLWEKTKLGAGISREFFFSYFAGRINGFAIKIKRPHLYNNCINPYTLPRFYPPQSFRYIHDSEFAARISCRLDNKNLGENGSAIPCPA